MNLEQLLDQLRSDPAIGPNIVHWQTLPPTPARYADWPAALDPRLVAVLKERGIHRLYTHQAEAIEAALAGQNTVVVTPTASGKTLCYNLPVLHAMLDEPRRAGALPLPDQGAGPGPGRRAAGPGRAARRATIKTYTYDGDTPRRRAPGHPRRPGTSSSPTPTCSTPASCRTTPSG